MSLKQNIKSTTQITQAKKARFVELYKQLNGHITDAAAGTGIERKTYYNWLDSDKEFTQAIMETEMELNDEIRDILINKAASGDMTAVIFYLKNRHPDFKQQPTIIQQFNVGKEMGVEFVQDETVQVT